MSTRSVGYASERLMSFPSRAEPERCSMVSRDESKTSMEYNGSYANKLDFDMRTQKHVVQAPVACQDNR
jgi:hypothetical protein